MASKPRSRWADDEETSAEITAQRRKEKEEKRRQREEKARRQQEAIDASTRAPPNGTVTDDGGPPPKRRRTSDPQTPSKAEEGAHILRFPARLFGASRDVNLYELLNNIEEGSYGFVSRARHKSSGEIVALKRLKLEHTNDGFPVTGLREIQTLKACEHQHIVHLHEVVVGNNLQDVYIVLDFIEHDLKTLLEDNPEPFLPSETKTLMQQLLSATAYLHEHHILHRDLKTSNLLLNNRGEIKVADFGMARYTADPPPANLTQLVVTLWYRAPELLLGATAYGPAIDVWSVGCIFAELLTREPLFPGKNEVDQLSLIFGLLGPPTTTTWPDFRSLPNAKALHPVLSRTTSTNKSNKLTPAKFPYLTTAGLNLLSSLLSLNPTTRPTASSALRDHPYFHEDPRPKPKEMFPTFPSRAGQEHRRRRRRSTPDAPVRGRAVPKMTVDDFVGFLGTAEGETGEEGEKGAGFALRLG